MKKFESDVCPYCELEENKDLTTDQDVVSIYIEDNLLRGHYDNWTNIYVMSEVKINYCPMCGRKLTEK